MQYFRKATPQLFFIIVVDIHPYVVKKRYHSKYHILIIGQVNCSFEHYDNHRYYPCILQVLIKAFDPVPYLHELKEVKYHEVCNPAVEHRESHMNSQKLLERYIVASIIQVLDSPISKVVDVYLQEEKRSEIHWIAVEPFLFTESERHYGSRLEKTLEGETPFYLEHQYVLEVLTSAEAAETAQWQDDKEYLEYNDEQDLAEEDAFGYAHRCVDESDEVSIKVFKDLYHSKHYHLDDKGDDVQ